MVGASVFYGLAARIRLCESISSGLRKSAGAGSPHYAVGVLYRGTTMASAIAEAGLWILILSAALVQSGWAGSATGCDRTCLEFFVNRYLAALVAHDKSGVAAVEGVKYTENQQIVPLGQGLWQTAVEIGSYRIYACDVNNSQIAFMGNIRTTLGWSMMALRLRIKDAHITEIETIFPGSAAGSGTYDLSAGAGRLKAARPAFSTALLPAERRDRSQLIWSADLHYEGIERGNGDIVPFGDGCIKVENGVQLIRNPDFHSPGVSPSGKPVPNFTAMGCRDQFNTHIWETDRVTDRRYPVVDEERGIAVAFAMYNQYIKGPCANVVDYGTVCPPSQTDPYTLVMAEAFKVRAGKIEEVESIFTPLPTLRLRGVW